MKRNLGKSARWNKLSSSAQLNLFTRKNKAEYLAKNFHELYEKMAHADSYETREESACEWKDVPEKNKKLMIAVCEELVRQNIIKVL